MSTPLSEWQIDALKAKLSSEHVKSREQSGRSLSYIEGWHAIAEANRIFGFDGWTRETFDVRCVAEHERPMKSGKGWGVSYIAKVRVRILGNEDVVREGIGAGHGIDRDLGLAHESAIKEAETDAMKRALMTFGNPFGLALYDKTQENVEDPGEAEKRAYVDRQIAEIQQQDTDAKTDALWRAEAKNRQLHFDGNAKDPEYLRLRKALADHLDAIAIQREAAE